MVIISKLLGDLSIAVMQCKINFWKLTAGSEAFREKKKKNKQTNKQNKTNNRTNKYNNNNNNNKD